MNEPQQNSEILQRIASLPPVRKQNLDVMSVGDLADPLIGSGTVAPDRLLKQSIVGAFDRGSSPRRMF